jgi:uncharacterized sporulation protein YeaH/YhbH (DUF444 family)
LFKQANFDRTLGNGPHGKTHTAKGKHMVVTLDELLERDRQREEDGFKRKIRIGRIVKPGTGGKEKIIVVPTTVEEKFVHEDPSFDPSTGEGESSSGTGEGEEGDIIGEQPVRPDEGEGEGEGQGAGEGEGEGQGGEHEFESNAYELGKVLSQDFQLPNLQGSCLQDFVPGKRV